MRWISIVSSQKSQRGNEWACFQKEEMLKLFLSFLAFVLSSSEGPRALHTSSVVSPGFFFPHTPVFFTHTHCFTVSRLVFYHPPSLYIPSSIHLSLSRSSLPPSLDLISQSAFYLSVFSHLVATAGKCKLCCFKYPCLPRAYSFRWAAGGVEWVSGCEEWRKKSMPQCLT